MVAESSSTPISRLASPRPETPEPGARQGHRNEPGAQLLDSEGAISDKFEQCLAHIFSKYCTPPVVAPVPVVPNGPMQLMRPPPGAVLTNSALDQWARDTNGAPFSKETKEELIEFLDVTDAGDLTFKGFLQIYQLQSENDEEESWRDLSSHGFDRNLNLVASRREDVEVDEGDPRSTPHAIRVDTLKHEAGEVA